MCFVFALLFTATTSQITSGAMTRRRRAVNKSKAAEQEIEDNKRMLRHLNNEGRKFVKYFFSSECIFISS